MAEHRAKFVALFSKTPHGFFDPSYALGHLAAKKIAAP